MVALEDVDVTTNIILMVRGYIAHLRLICRAILKLDVQWRTTVNIRLVAIATIHLTKDTLTHIRVCNDVDSLVALAIVHARELGVVRELVEDLDTVYSLRRE